MPSIYSVFTGGSGSGSLTDASVQTLEQSNVIYRDNAIKNVEPTALEFPNASDGDIGMVVLNTQEREIWRYETSAWVRKQTMTAPVTTNAVNNVATADVTVAVSDFAGDDYHGVAVNTDGGPRSVTLPNGVGDGVEFMTSRLGTNNLTIIPGAGESIQGDVSGVVLNVPGFARFKKSGTNWTLIQSGKA